MLIIDYQPVQLNLIASMDPQRLIDNIVGVAKPSHTAGLRRDELLTSGT
jgi:hypothetical protein